LEKREEMCSSGSFWGGSTVAAQPRPSPVFAYKNRGVEKKKQEQKREGREEKRRERREKRGGRPKEEEEEKRT
jgi:hypothetical protein